MSLLCFRSHIILAASVLSCHFFFHILSTNTSWHLSPCIEISTCLKVGLRVQINMGKSGFSQALLKSFDQSNNRMLNHRLFILAYFTIYFVGALSYHLYLHSNKKKNIAFFIPKKANSLNPHFSVHGQYIKHITISWISLKKN